MWDSLKASSEVPNDKKAYIQQVGKYLVKKNGKKKFYKPNEVIEASRNTDYFKAKGLKSHSWAMCIFVNHQDFDEYHKNKKESYDYQNMRKQLLQAMTSNTKSDYSDWLIVPEIALDMSWLDFGDIFGNIFDGIGDIISGIFDGI